MSIQRWKCVLALCALGTVTRAQTPPSGIAGEWNGAIAGKLRMSLQIEKAEGPGFKGVLVSIDQGNAKLPIDDISFDGKQAVRFEWKNIGASYEATLSSDGSQLDGLFQQGGSRLPLVFRRAGAAPVTATLKPMTRGSVRLQPCLVSDGITQALCGTYEVYENRVSRTGRKIALNLMILPALAEKPEADPVFAFAGGPGESAVSTFPLVMFTKILQQQRDIVLIDERGTGKSNPLPCPLDTNNAQTLVADPYPAESLPACRAELEKHADLTQYTTSIAVDDVDDVRAALGYDKINAVGGSYGSLSALVYLRRHGDHMRSAAIEAVAPPDYRLPLPFAKTIQSSLDRLFANCAADPGCAKNFPNLKAEFETTLKRLDSAPATLDKPQPITISRGPFVTDLRTLLYVPALVSRLPYILHRAYENDWTPFVDVVTTLHRSVGDQIARGLAYSVLCSESLPFITEADIKGETAGTYLGDFDVRKYRKKCALWPHATVAKDFLEPVRSDVPVLLIAGEEDPATPTWLAERAAKYLSHGRVIDIPNGTHLTSANCTDNLIAQFIRTGSEKQVDAACVAQIHRPAFVNPNTGQ